MLAGDLPSADIDGGGGHAVGGEPLEQQGGADDIGDRIECAGLVEVHLGRSDAVDLGLRRDEPLEDIERAVLHFRGQIGP